MKTGFFRALRVHEAHTLGSQVVDAASGYDAEALSLNLTLLPIENKLNELSGLLNKLSTAQLTELVEQADEVRDRAFRALVYYLQAANMRNKSEWNAAAGSLNHLLESYGVTLYENSYNEESSKINNLLADIEESTEYGNAINQLGLNEWLAELKDAQTNFEQAQKNRLEYSANQKTDHTAADVKLQLLNAIRNFFEYVELMAKINPAPEFKELENKLNIITDKYSTSVKQRQQKKEDTMPE